MDDLTQAPRGALAETMGIQLFRDGDVVVATMPVEGNTQPYGILHGGATAVLVETVGSVASALANPGRFPVGIELSVSHHRSASQGTVTARAEALHVGRTLASYLIPVTDDAGRQIATGRLTCLLRDAIR
ncbi:MAG: hotdog fold thioesterase [Candidatus Nanopelagicales bacterium]